jgi:hypothetical protein
MGVQFRGQHSLSCAVQQAEQSGTFRVRQILLACSLANAHAGKNPANLLRLLGIARRLLKQRLLSILRRSVKRRPPLLSIVLLLMLHLLKLRA